MPAWPFIQSPEVLRSILNGFSRSSIDEEKVKNLNTKYAQRARSRVRQAPEDSRNRWVHKEGPPALPQAAKSREETPKVGRDSGGKAIARPIDTAIAIGGSIERR